MKQRILLAAFVVVRVRYLAPLASTIDMSSVGFLPFGLCVVVVVGGMLVGCVGGIVASWNR